MSKIGLIQNKFEMIYNENNQGPLQICLKRNQKVLTNFLLEYYFAYGHTKAHYELMMKSFPIILGREEIHDDLFLTFITSESNLDEEQESLMGSHLSIEKTI